MHKLKNCSDRSSPLASNCQNSQTTSHSRKQAQSLDPNLQEDEARWVMKDNRQSNPEFDNHMFVSINRCFEIVKRSNYSQKQTNREVKDGKVNRQIDDQSMTCYCGRKYKLKNNFLSHIRGNHLFAIESLAYLHNKQQFQQKMIRLPQFQIQKAELLSRIKQSLLIPEELKTLISSSQKAKIIQEANKIIGFKATALEKMKQIETDNRSCLFSSTFSQIIRIIAMKCVQTFDRRVSIYLKNTNFISVLYLFVFNLFTIFTETNIYPKSILIPWSALIETGCIEFLKWVDENYITVCKRKGVFHQHIQLQQGERYTEKERVNKKELFANHYLQQLSSKQENKLKLKTMQLVLIHFVNWVKEKIQ